MTTWCLLAALKKKKRMQLCPSCGAYLPDEARFCGQCGRLFEMARTVQPRGAEEIVQADVLIDQPAPLKRHARQPYRYPPLPTDAQQQPGVAVPPAGECQAHQSSGEMSSRERWAKRRRIPLPQDGCTDHSFSARRSSGNRQLLRNA